jgi:hypothetical protein
MKSSYVPSSVLGTTIEPSEMTLGAGVGTGILARPIFATTVADGGATTTTLTVTSASKQELTGSTYHFFKVPDVSTLAQGWATLFVNISTGILNIYASDGSTKLAEVEAGESATIICRDTAGGTGTAGWDVVGQSRWLLATAVSLTTVNNTETDFTWENLDGKMRSALSGAVFTAPAKGYYTFRLSLRYEGTSGYSTGGDGSFTVKLTDNANSAIVTIRSGGTLFDYWLGVGSVAASETIERTILLDQGATVKIRSIFTDGGNGAGLYFYSGTCQLKITKEQ